MATTRRADMFIDLEDDPRENAPTLADERTTLVEALRGWRLTLEVKCAGLDADDMARRAVEPSTMSLLGLVRHLADGERATFRVMMAGHDVPSRYCSPTDRDGTSTERSPTPEWSRRRGTPGGRRSPSPSGSWRTHPASTSPATTP